MDIEHPPLMVDMRQQMGNFEGDTLIGKGYKGALVTLVDCATKDTKIHGLKNRLTEIFYGFASKC